jgi:hypothetical protein
MTPDMPLYIRDKHIQMLEKTLQTWHNIFAHVSQETATTLRDGADGWTSLEILCHIHEYDLIFLQRGQSVLTSDKPLFHSYDVDALARERGYNSRQLSAMLPALDESRAALIAFYRSIADDQWDRSGVHPSYGEQTLLRMLIQAAHHNIDHIEQATRVLAGT